MLRCIQNFDTPVLDFISMYCRNPVLDRLMPVLTGLGNMGIIWLTISAVLIAGKKYRKTGLMVLGSIILATVLGEGMLKHLVQRPRPCVDIPAPQLLIPKPASYSFPSGHTTVAFAAAFTILRKYNRAGLAAVLLASLIAFSRMYLYVHYPTDILGGILLGLFCSMAIGWLVDWDAAKAFFKAMIKKTGNRKPEEKNK